jgi:hypothetical protein
MLISGVQDVATISDHERVARITRALGCRLWIRRRRNCSSMIRDDSTAAAWAELADLTVWSPPPNEHAKARHSTVADKPTISAENGLTNSLLASSQGIYLLQEFQ